MACTFAFFQSCRTICSESDTNCYRNGAYDFLSDFQYPAWDLIWASGLFDAEINSLAILSNSKGLKMQLKNVGEGFQK